MLIRAKAPLRISFAGGGTDVVPFPQEEGGAVLNATITKFAHATLRSRDDRQIKIESLDLDEIGEYELDEPLEFDGKLDLIKAAIKRVGPEDSTGFSLFLQSNAPPGSGLGSSSTMMVALVGLLVAARNLALTEYEIAELAHSIERTDLGVGGGSQDHYSATFGGFNFIEFEADRVIVNPLRISPDTIYELEHNLLLCYTGTTRELRAHHRRPDRPLRGRRVSDPRRPAAPEGARHRDEERAAPAPDLATSAGCSERPGKSRSGCRRTSPTPPSTSSTRPPAAAARSAARSPVPAAAAT